MASKKGGLPYDRKGGVVAIQNRLLASEAYLRLTPFAKALIPLLQRHWRNDRPVGYGIREAMDSIPCCKTVAMRTFEELQEAGFIVMVDESLFCSRTKSKTRTWRLTWLPFNYCAPTNDWEKRDAA